MDPGFRRDDGMKGERLVALSVLGFLLFNYPLLALFNRPEMLFGIPVLYVYIFAVWAFLIAAIARIAEKKSSSRP
jgi:hypothetical protein